MEWSEIWGVNFRFEELELIDLGDRLVALADVPMRAQTSGIPFTGNYAAVIKQQVREQHHLRCLGRVVELDLTVARGFLKMPMAPANSADVASCSPGS